MVSTCLRGVRAHAVAHILNAAIRCMRRSFLISVSFAMDYMTTHVAQDVRALGHLMRFPVSLDCLLCDGCLWSWLAGVCSILAQCGEHKERHTGMPLVCPWWSWSV